MAVRCNTCGSTRPAAKHWTESHTEGIGRIRYFDTVPFDFGGYCASKECHDAFHTPTPAVPDDEAPKCRTCGSTDPKVWINKYGYQIVWRGKSVENCADLFHNPAPPSQAGHGAGEALPKYVEDAMAGFSPASTAGCFSKQADALRAAIRRYAARGGETGVSK
jgi:hypothetical protein